MKTNISALLACLTLTLATSATAVEVKHQHHIKKDAATVGAQSQLKRQKLEAEAPLRQAMGDLNKAVMQALPLIHEERFSKENYQTLANTVGQAVEQVMADSSLAQLTNPKVTRLLSDLMGGAELMEEAASDDRHAGVEKVKGALNDYGRNFEHPGWTAVVCPR
jgi:hypothetical protein